MLSKNLLGTNNNQNENKFALNSTCTISLKHVHHGCDGQVGCLLAWWSLSLHGWRTSWCLQTIPPSRLRKLPGVLRWLHFGNASQFWNPEQSLWPTSGMEACGSKAQWTFGIYDFHEEQRYLKGKLNLVK